MAIWIQSLSWTLIYSLGQGLLIYILLRLLLRTAPGMPASFKYRLSLVALGILPVWFAATWWQQYHFLGASTSITSSVPPDFLVKQPPSPVEGGFAGSLLPYLEAILPWLSVLYIGGLLFMLARLMLGLQQLFTLRSKGVSQPDGSVTALAATLKHRLRLDIPVQLFVSARAHVPMVVGMLKPVILLPAAALTQLNTQQLETILLHELAHIKRHDYLVNILQTIMETVLFFNPFAWMISSIVRRERELCCDDLVLVLGSDPVEYATALTALSAPSNSFTIAASTRSYQLFNRIKRIMEMKKNSFSYSRVIAAICLSITITCFAAWMTPSFAQATHEETRIAAPPGKIPGNNSVSADKRETDQLIQRMLRDGIIDETKGFTVEKKQGNLFINGQLQAADITARYLNSTKQEQIRVQVHPFKERVRMHPGASLLQLALPATLSSPCVDNSAAPKKPGC